MKKNIHIFCNTSVDDAKTSVKMAEKSGNLNEETLKENINYEKNNKGRDSLIKFFEGKLKKIQKDKKIC